MWSAIPAVYVVEVAVSPLAGYDCAVPGHTGGAPLRTVTAVVVGAPLHNSHINYLLTFAIPPYEIYYTRAHKNQWSIGSFM